MIDLTNSQTCYDLANSILLIGTINNFRALIRDRKALKGFSVFGSATTCIGCFLVGNGYLHEGHWVSLILISPTILYWGMVAVLTQIYPLLFNDANCSYHEEQSDKCRNPCPHGFDPKTCTLREK